MNWLVTMKNVAGITSPVVQGKRTFFHIEAHEYFPMEAQAGEEALLIGKYSFSRKSFMKAEETLMSAIGKSYEWIIIDEIGPLELSESGLHKVLLEILQKTNSNLLLVVRDSILHDVIKKYNLTEPNILNIKSFPS